MSLRVLLVEDEEHLRFSLEFNLTAEGYAVDLAENATQARARFDERYAIILLDVMLPDGNGIELCRELRDRGNLAPVLFLTARDGSDNVVAGLDAGGDDYLAKPFALQELLSRIGALVRRRRWDAQGSAEPQLRFDRNVIDFANRKASANGEAVPLTDLELRLLRFFADNPGRVIAREELLERVWEIAPTSRTRAVDNFIVRLRRLFERDPSAPRHFLTVRGVGYRFEP